MFDKNKLGLLYLTNERFDFYSPTAATILTYYFPPEIVKDLEIINREVFAVNIQSFIDRNKLTPVNLVIILSENTYFERNLTDTMKYDTQTELENFMDTVPFENTSAKIYPLEKGTKIVGTNRDFYEAISTAFSKQGFVVVFVVPAFVLRNLLPQAGLDRVNCEAIVAKIEAFEKNNLVSQSQVVGSSSQESADIVNKRMVVLLVIFFLLLTLLIFLLTRDLLFR